MRRRYRLKNKRRFAAFLFCILLLPLLILSSMNVRAETINEPNLQTIKVDAGDTLWEIASELSGKRDVRQVVYEIKKLNQLNNDVIYGGQWLKLP